MIRGHRRKGFVDPPKPVVDEKATETPKEPQESPKAREEKQRSPSPITMECDLNVTPPSAVIEVRNKRLFDSSGFHDPKSALQPAKIRFRRMKSTPTEELLEISSNESKASDDSLPSSTIKALLAAVEDSTPPAESSEQSKQSQPTPILDETICISDTESEQPSSPPQSNELPTVKRGRRIKITPRRDTLTNSENPKKETDCPKNVQQAPATIQPISLPFTCNQQNAMLSSFQPSLGISPSFIVPQNLYQTSAVAQLLIHQQMFSTQQYSMPQYYTPLLIQQPQSSLRNFFENYTP